MITNKGLLEIMWKSLWDTQKAVVCDSVDSSGTFILETPGGKLKEWEQRYPGALTM